MTLLQALKGWEWIKVTLSTELRLDRPILHIHAGLALYVLATMLLRRSSGSVLPLLTVAAVEVANEGLDFARYQVSGWPWTPWGTVRDVFDTLFWPTILTLIGKIWRSPPQR